MHDSVFIILQHTQGRGMQTLESLRQEYELNSNRALSMPIAGMIVWLAIGVISLLVPDNINPLVLMFGSGVIFPLALAIATKRNELLTDNSNPFSKLMGMSVLMVNLLWALHIVLFFAYPEAVYLSIGIGLGLHWIVYSWIIKHPLGLQHAIIRTVFVTLAWFYFPDERLFAVSFVIVITYLVTLVQMASRPVPALMRKVEPFA